MSVVSIYQVYHYSLDVHVSYVVYVQYTSVSI